MQCINYLRFSDDMLLLAKGLEGLQGLAHRAIVVNEQNSVTLNVRKTKFIVISRTQQQGTRYLI